MGLRFGAVNARSAVHFEALFARTSYGQFCNKDAPGHVRGSAQTHSSLIVRVILRLSSAAPRTFTSQKSSARFSFLHIRSTLECLWIVPRFGL